MTCLCGPKVRQDVYTTQCQNPQKTQSLNPKPMTHLPVCQLRFRHLWQVIIVSTIRTLQPVQSEPRNTEWPVLIPINKVLASHLNVYFIARIETPNPSPSPYFVETHIPPACNHYPYTNDDMWVLSITSKFLWGILMPSFPVLKTIRHQASVRLTQAT